MYMKKIFAGFMLFLAATLAGGAAWAGQAGTIGGFIQTQTKALAEGFVAGPLLLNQGGDFLAWAGMRQRGVYAIISGGASTYHTNSQVEMDSLSLITGVSWCSDLTLGRLAYGAFIEYGSGSYDTFNSFSNAASVKGEGDTHYLGGGVLGRMDFNNTGDSGHVYTELSLRAGSIKNDFKTSDLRNAGGQSAVGYDTSSSYFGLYFGAGYIMNISEKAVLNLYSKYFWTRQSGDSFTLGTGDPVNYKAVNSYRLRGGARYSYDINESSNVYVGAAWEYEFDGEAKGTMYGFKVPSTCLRGSTGIGELGFIFKPSLNQPLYLDLSVQGYTGKREGWTGRFQVKYEF